MCIFLVYEMAMQFSICNWCIFLYTLIHHYIFLNFFIPLNIWTHDLDVGENWHLYVASCFCSQKKLGSQTLPLAFLDEAHTWFKGPNGSSCSNCSYSESHGWKLYASRVWTPGSLFLPASLARMYTGPVYILHVWQGFENLRVMWCTTIYIYIISRCWSFIYFTSGTTDIILSKNMCVWFVELIDSSVYTGAFDPFNVWSFRFFLYFIIERLPARLFPDPGLDHSHDLVDSDLGCRRGEPNSTQPLLI